VSRARSGSGARPWTAPETDRADGNNAPPASKVRYYADKRTVGCQGTRISVHTAGEGQAPEAGGSTYSLIDRTRVLGDELSCRPSEAASLVARKAKTSNGSTVTLPERAM